MAKEFFKDLPNTTTPLTASRLNGLLDGEEALGNLVVDSIRSKNMFDKYNIMLNTALDSTTGTTVTNNARITSSYIEVKPNTSYIFSNVNDLTTNGKALCFYNSSKTFISGTELSLLSVGIFTTPASAKYIRFGYVNTGNYSDLQLEEGISATTYLPHQSLDNETIIVGEATYNTTYFNTPSFNKIIRTGNVIQLYFKAKINTAWTSNTDILTNLPQNILNNNYTFGAYMGDDEYLPNDNAKLIFAWTQQNGTSIRMAPQEIIANKYLYILLTYITN